MSAASALLEQLRLAFPHGATTGSFDATAVADGAYVSLLDSVAWGSRWDLTSSTGWELDENEQAVTFQGVVTSVVSGVSHVPVFFQFTPSADGFVMLVDLELPAGWTFTTSFPSLNAEVFDEIALDPDEKSALVLSSGPAADHRRQVEGRPLAVERGLHFWGYLHASSPFLVLLEALVPDAVKRPVSAPLTVVGTTLEMDIPLASGDIADLFGVGLPPLHLELDLHASQDDGDVVAGVAFTASVELATHSTLSLSALLESSDDGVIVFSLSATDLPLPSLDDLATLFFGSNNEIHAYIPAEMKDHPLLQVADVSLGLGLGSGSIVFASLALAGPDWNVFPKEMFPAGDVSLLSPTLSFSIFSPLGDSPSYVFEFAAELDIAGVKMIVQGELPAGVFSAALDPSAARPSLAPLVERVFGTTKGMPDRLLVERLALSVDLARKTYAAGIEIAGDWNIPFGHGRGLTFDELELHFEASPAGAQGGVKASFEVGDESFDVSLDMSSQGVVFKGEMTETDAPLDYQDIAVALGMYGLPELPEGLNVGIESASFAFDTSKPRIDFDLQTTKGEAALVAGKDAAGNWAFAFGALLGLDLQVHLTDIDVVGKLVPTGFDVIGISELRVVGGTGELSSFQLDEKQQNVFGDALHSGLAVSTQLEIGTSFTTTIAARFGGSDEAAARDLPPSASQVPAASPTTTPTTPTTTTTQPTPAPPPQVATPSAPQVTWVDVQRAFGPVHVNRVGLGLDSKNELRVALDATVALAGLTVGLAGLEADIPLTAPFKPKFSLRGLAVGYSGPGVSITGGLSSVAPGSFSGDLAVVAGNFGAIAIGAYETASAQPSLFAFVLVDYPLGGPPFFFVTGLAGGFGYNRSLKKATITDVASHPLIQGARGSKDAAAAGRALADWIKPAVNEHWLAAGVEFTSFETVTSVALLTVEFGTHTAIALLGRSTLIVPTATPEKPSPVVAKVIVDFLVTVDPEIGQLAVDAAVGPGSFLVHENVKLSGGAALYAWFAPSSHAGDFVLTVGGYHPRFAAPAHYPAPKRLELNWQVSQELSVKGDLYFALTPSVVMAGLSVHASYERGDVSAWFDARADFLIRFKPFHYEVDLRVGIGVGYTVGVGRLSTRITTQLDVDLSLWGPPFGGQAHVDLGAFSFTIGFGELRGDVPRDLDWGEFRSSLLPLANDHERQEKRAIPSVSGARPSEPTSTDTLVTIAAPSGLLGTEGAQQTGRWLVDPARLRLVVSTQIPSTTATVHAPGGSHWAPLEWNKSFGVGPMGKVPAGGGASPVEVDLTVTVSAASTVAYEVVPIRANVPAGLWLQHEPTMSAESTVKDVLTGLSLAPKGTVPDKTLPMSLRRLLAGEPPRVSTSWSSGVAPDAGDFDRADSLTRLEEALLAAGDARARVLGVLQSAGASVSKTVDVTHFAARASSVLAAPPMWSALGGADLRSEGATA